jgi:oligopeptide transport system substrate-binding protein
LRWSDGAKLTADDFARGLHRAVDPSTNGPNAYLLSLIRRDTNAGSSPADASTLAVRALDEDTLEIRLRAPAPFFPALMSNAIAYPAYRGNPDGARSAHTSAISNGAYTLTRQTPGGAIVLERNPYYWDAANVSIPRVEYVAIADSNIELLRYRAGQLDVTSFVPATQLDALRRELPGELQIRPQLAVVYYAFNLTASPLKNSRGLREALSLAIDRERLTSAVLRGGQVPAFGFVPPGIPGYENPEYAWRAEPQDARSARARTVYHAAGYTATRPLHLRLLCPDDDTLRRVALAVASMWRETLGVDVAPTFLEYRAFLAAREQRGDWDVISHGWNADYPDPGNFLSVFTSDSPQNDGRLTDAAYDRLLAELGLEADGARRLARLAQAEQALLDDYAIAPLYFAVSRRLVKPRVAGAVLSPMNHNYSKYLSLR